MNFEGLEDRLKITRAVVRVFTNHIQVFRFVKTRTGASEMLKELSLKKEGTQEN